MIPEYQKYIDTAQSKKKGKQKASSKTKKN